MILLQPAAVLHFWMLIQLKDVMIDEKGDLLHLFMRWERMEKGGSAGKGGFPYESY